jgi:putative PIN family toxin of toxin-antitoxin system
MAELFPLRLVLDTNTVMALWFFGDPALLRLRRGIEAHRLHLVTRADALEELRRVLAYRRFGLPADRQASIIAAYSACSAPLAGSGVGPPSGAPAPLPACRDRDDQKFLEIARDGGATHLVSRDKALLKLNRHRLLRPLFAVVTPEAFTSSLPAD